MKLHQELKNNMVEYDLNNQDHRKIIEDFEKELAGKDFNEYCLDMGYFTKRETKLPDGNLLTEYLFVPEKIKELALVYSKLKSCQSILK